MSLSHLQMRLCAVRQLRQNDLLLTGTVPQAIQRVLHCATKASQRPLQPLDFRGEALTLVFRFRRWSSVTRIWGHGSNLTSRQGNGK